jgi:hypothetical protein
VPVDVPFRPTVAPAIGLLLTGSVTVPLIVKPCACRLSGIMIINNDPRKYRVTCILKRTEVCISDCFKNQKYTFRMINAMIYFTNSLFYEKASLINKEAFKGIESYSFQNMKQG